MDNIFYAIETLSEQLCRTEMFDLAGYTSLKKKIAIEIASAQMMIL